MAVARWRPVLTSLQSASSPAPRGLPYSTSGGGNGSQGGAGGSEESGRTTLNFEDTREAYRSMSFSELFRHYVVFKAFTYKSLVDNNKSVSLRYDKFEV
jgi:hypothetical protein